MNSIRQSIVNFFTHQSTIPAGVYHYQAPPEAEKPYRLHLRIEPDGMGILIVNAKTVLHLNQTAAEYAYHLVMQTPEEELAKEISKRYRVGREQALLDYKAFSEKIQLLISTPDVDPEAFLDLERRDPYTTELTAPYRLDCALTYRVEEEIPGKIAPMDRVKRELLTEEWKIILDKAWAAGIPHVVFTGGEPTLRPDLVDLIVYAEKLGQVSGLLTTGLRLAEPKYLHELLQAGLDHVLFLLDPLDEQSWEALRDALAEDLFITVHLTVTQKNADQVNALLDRLAVMGTRSLSLSGDDPSRGDLLKAAQQAASEHQLSLAWDLPVPYSKFHPLSLELAEGEKQVDGAGKAWLYVEPDGDVLKGQGIQGVLGNLLTDPWEQIWGKVK